MASSSSSPKQYDAFISHRGPDVKETLAKQLYKLLQERGCRAFLDREEIEGGESITSAIENAIRSSVVQIAIFSKGYAQSSWCLEELVLMLNQQPDALFIPVFYDVQPWELRYIEKKKRKRNEKKSQYTAAFCDYQRKGRNLDNLSKWKDALASAAGISGYERSRHQDNLCEEIVSRVLEEMKRRKPLHVAKYPVGLAEQVQDFEDSFSQTVRDKVRIAGIFGLGGSGKTTLATELFNRKRLGYKASCFLSDVRDSDLRSLQSQLCKDLFLENRKFDSIAKGIGHLEHRLGTPRDWHFLIVLDDIDHRDQLDTLLPAAMLSSGSLVIITTRNQSLLAGADIFHRMKKMNFDHARTLFCSHAFCRPDPPTSYEKLVERFVGFCGGLPLALKVLGSHVYGKGEHFWELELEKVKKIQPNDIMQRLRISFDSLDREEKQIFIDIACFFNKKVKYDLKSKAITIWKASGWSNAEHALQILQDRCLLESAEHERFEMHDHLRDLGRQIVDELSPRRLWQPELLGPMEAKGFRQILAETNGGRCFHSFWDPSLGMRISFFIAEADLLWLEMNKYGVTFMNIPSWIPLRKLHCLYIWSVRELWSTFQQQLQTYTQATFQLRRLWIWSCPYLQKLPDLIEMFTHLEELDIRFSIYSTDITSLVQSLGRLSKLRSLRLVCTNLDFSEKLDLSKGNVDSSTSSRMDSLETIHLGNLLNTSKLVVSGEMCPRLRSLTVSDFRNLKEMELKHLERLNTLRVEECYNLETISGLSTLTELQVLKVENCAALKSLPTLSDLHSLQKITIFGCGQLQG
ncbi:disease resistance protein Roq1-like [Cryptomeria japonica]|uniref:disease resistance protein Roq1-like n=1 Tax=Cryptomeria japonica TaxID=3369 RepID=UPI0027D9DEFE|nr:disease resistance protein Roq1-like [Cryptomeria japonica]